MATVPSLEESAPYLAALVASSCRISASEVAALTPIGTSSPSSTSRPASAAP